MKKLSKKKIVILIVLIAILIIQIKAFRDSRANKIIDVTAKIVDSNGLLSDEQFILTATNEGKSGMVITLPDIVNTKKISKYSVIKKEIVELEKLDEVKNTISAEKIIEAGATETTEILENTIDASTMEENSIPENTADITTEEKDTIVEKFSGEKLYLTQEEIDNKQIELRVEYDTIEVDTQILYNKKITARDNDDYELFSISGYMPNDIQIELNAADISSVENELIQNCQNNCIIRKL